MSISATSKHQNRENDCTLQAANFPLEEITPLDSLTLAMNC